VLSLPPSVRLFVAREPVDMRKAIDGLSGVVRDVLAEDPTICGEPRYVAGDELRTDCPRRLPTGGWYPAT
jgi:IS66 Orf2 like protein